MYILKGKIIPLVVLNFRRKILMPNRGEKQRTGRKYVSRALEIAAKVVYPHGVEWTIKTFRPYKAPGTVGISHSTTGGVWYTRCGNKETGLLSLLISGHVDDEEESRALTRGLPSTVTQRFIHAHRLVWP